MSAGEGYLVVGEEYKYLGLNFKKTLFLSPLFSSLVLSLDIWVLNAMIFLVFTCIINKHNALLAVLF